MKTLHILTLSFCITLFMQDTAIGQNIYPGITVGGSTNQIALKGIPETTSTLNNFYGAEAGLYLQISTGSFYVRPIALASFIRGTVQYSDSESAVSESTFNLATLEVPVMAGLHIFPAFSIEAGPSWNYLMNYSEELNNVQLNFSNHTLGYRAGVRLVISRFGLFGHYGGMIADLDDSKYDLKRPSRIILGMTFNITEK